ncbi:ABC transporter ATP-binding protein [Pseudorhodoplanes sp.]|uniref:ABC transporter ATP-binding protein n=1 Tax=Pseudorhodoplanes sp. TaxID=1934341 RepID=UPI00391C952F
MSEPLLAVRSLAGGYGPVDVLFDVDLHIEPGHVVALCGRNGMGKTSTIRAIMGALTHRNGTIRFGGQSLVGKPPHVIARLGIGIVPEGRQLFPSLSIRENLEVLARGTLTGGWTLQRAIDLFPRLGSMLDRPAWQTSGGEQQMIAISRALMTNPKLLILDEATEGLAPLVRHQIWQTLHRLKTEGLALLVIDKNLRALSRIADFCYVLERGRTSWRGTGEQLAAERENVERMLTV